MLAGIVCGDGSRRALDYALRRLAPAHFTDPVAAKLFELAEVFLDGVGGVLTRPVLTDMLHDKPPGTALLYQEYFDSLIAAYPADLPAWKHSVNQLRVLAEERQTGEALSQSMTILTTGAMEGKRTLKGAADARSWAISRFAEIERELRMADAPEGDMRTESADMVNEYERRRTERSAGRQPGVSTGIPPLDMVLGGGYQPGELVLIAGFTSAGKTSLAVQTAWHACVEQGKNVVIFTTETLRPQVRIKVLARHSLHPKFGRSQGLNSRDIRAGTLTPEDDAVLRSVIEDFGSGQYGRMHIAQVPRGATISTLEGRLARITRLWHADLVIIDYLQLLKSDAPRRELREGLVGIVQDAKQLAATYRDGQGVPVISPWQMNREGWKKAQEKGFYELSDLAETNEAGATADVVLSALEPKEDNSAGRHVLVKLGVPKNRDGERRAGSDQAIPLIADYACSRFEAEVTERAAVESLLGSV